MPFYAKFYKGGILMSDQKRKETKLESLLVQSDVLSLMRRRHQVWANDTNDIEIARIHLEIVSLIQLAQDRYEQIFEKYNQPSNKYVS